MLCFGIESSCDDTSVALVEGGRLLGQETSSQATLHALFGGVVPEMASREHSRFIGPLCDRLLTSCGVAPHDIDVVAVARGPGLLGSLLVGVAFAKAFALGAGACFLGINHLHAHIFSAGIGKAIPLPALALLVSGGHTHLYRVDGPRQFVLLGKSLDDAAGEAFDKAGKLLGLPYPAGRHIDILADEGRADDRLFPRPYLANDNCDFSFSGLKTAMAVYLKTHPAIEGGSFDPRNGCPILPVGKSRAVLADVCASYRLAVVDTLAAKVHRALDGTAAQGVRSLILAGGVAANSLLRDTLSRMAETYQLVYCVPEPALCTDNGAMIAYLGWLLASDGHEHGLSMPAVARGQKVPDDMRRSGAALEAVLRS